MITPASITADIAKPLTAGTTMSTRPRASAGVRHRYRPQRRLRGSRGGLRPAGLLSNSVALLADAGHNMSDVLGLGVAWSAAILTKRAPTPRFTYGADSCRSRPPKRDDVARRNGMMPPAITR